MKSKYTPLQDCTCRKSEKQGMQGGISGQPQLTMAL